MMHFKPTLFVACLLTVKSVSSACLHATSLEEAGRKVKVSEFVYASVQGPLNWGGLSEKNLAGASSSRQSPINIDNSIELAKLAPKIAIASVDEAEFEKLGTTVEVIVNCSTAVGDNVFNVKQFHFRTRSEHRIREEYYPLEMHMVHEASGASQFDSLLSKNTDFSIVGSGGIVVLTVMCELSDRCTTDLLTYVTKNVQDIEEPGSVTRTNPLDFEPLVELQTTPLLQFSGSLTTPPYADGLPFFRDGNATTDYRRNFPGPQKGC
jgi:carbonic anhydrase